MKNVKKESNSQISKKVNVPVAKAQIRKTVNPSIRNINLSGDIKVAHREFISDVNGSTGFSAVNFAVNPGLSQAFPWLSCIARRYESYRFERLRFLFETSSPTTKTGSVLGVIDYDVSDSAPSSKVQAMSYRSAVRSPPWSDFSMDSKKSDLDKRSSYFVRSKELSGIDLKLYDTGNFYLCTQGQDNTNSIGELYVEYVVSLMTPQLDDSSSDYLKLTGTSNSSPFATKTGNINYSLISTGTTSSQSTLTFNESFEGYVSISIQGTGVSGLVITGTATQSNVQATGDGSTARILVCDLVAQSGSTLIVTITNTTVTAATLRLSSADL